MRRLLLAAVSGLLWTAPALAEVVVQEPPTVWHPQGVTSGHTVDLVTGLGFGGFTGNLGHFSSLGISWNLRGVYNFSRFIGIELDYQGTNSYVDSYATAAGAFCCVAYVEQQITADLKLGVPFRTGHGYLRPYAFAGAGYGYISVNNNIAPVAVWSSESVGAFPFGGGLSYEVSPGLIFDVRYTYNVLTEGSGNVWNVLFDIGVRMGVY